VEVYGEPMDSEPDTEAPTNLNASLDSTTPNSASFLLRAEDNSGIVEFNVTQNGITESFIGTSGIEMTATVVGLSPNTTYEFTIGVKDESGNISNETQTVSVTTPQEFENTPCQGESNTATQGSFEVGYKYSLETDGTNVIIEFELLDDKDDIVAYLWKESPFTETSMSNIEGQRFRAVLSDQNYGQSLSYACKFAFAGGLAVTTYFTYTVGEDCSGNQKDDDNDGVENEIDICPDTSSDVIVNENGCEIKISEKIELYPNPTNGRITLTLPVEINIISIQIFNINGKKLIDIFHSVSKLSREIKLDLSHYPTGIYFINLSAKNLNETIELIKY
jgi:hypothetical protein